MRKYIYSLGLALLFLCPIIALGQGYMPWPAVEDTIIVPGGSTLNLFIAQDTAGTLWQGANGTTAWQNRTRVYVLLANQRYDWSAAFTLTAANRSIFIRAEQGKNYSIPWTPGMVQRPVLRSNAAFATAWFVLNAVHDTMAIKNIAWTAYDEILTPTNLDVATGTFITMQTNGRGGIYIDSCILTGGITVVNNTGRNMSLHPDSLHINGGVIRVTNSILGDWGTLQRSNLGAGRIIDLRSAGVDTLDMYNNAIFNVIDRVVRYLGSPKPIYSFNFVHNTVVNCVSYHGFLSLGWIDSLGNGPFRIKDNLFVDPYAMGPDTDWTRQGEMPDNPDKDINLLGKCSWVIARQNTDAHVTPWEISNNYYYISDSGKAVRDYETGVGLHHVYYGSTAPEPILTTDIARQVDASGGNSTTAFTLADIQFAYGIKFPSRMVRWYFDPYAPGYLPTTIGGLDSCVGAGAGKLKDASAPSDNFARLSQFVTRYDQFNRFPYDLKRLRIDSVMSWMDLSFYSNTDLSGAASDGKIVGATMYSYLGVPPGAVGDGNQIPLIFALTQNYPNPFNPSTTFEYVIGKSGFVTVKIINILGQEVATLVNEFKQAGSYPISWDASGFSSGVYFYKMQSGSFSATKKMILMK
jgi:hypothetical protein